MKEGIRRPKITIKKTPKRMKKTNHSFASVSKPTLDDDQVQELIRLKAYEIYLERGYQHGNDVDDWLTAEKIVFQSL